MNTKEFITNFGSIIFLNKKDYNNFIKKINILNERKPKEYDLINGKELPTEWFPKKSPEELIKELYENK